MARQGRTQRCGQAEARTRLQDARAHLDLADLHGPTSDAAARKAAISAAVLAGIAAADAVCCAALGERSRSQNHRDATELVHGIAPGGPAAAKRLAQLLDVKDASQYGFKDLTGQRLTAALRQAHAVVAWAETIVLR
ncbi:MAG TPA: hypothetical protein VFG42_08370 [Baekduia sp.]|uniref:hypothetical protein n=1 Tax=Baekduia sp. TaxID=2600305 RepID=UPI002D76859B|nr:hypothetical protein [Baekduia sp.]HET6506790.1 hypothetical protein [Baekduia sp.]